MAKTPWLHEYVSPENVDVLASECGLNERDAILLRALFGTARRPASVLAAAFSDKAWRIQRDQHRAALALGRYLCELAGQHLALDDTYEHATFCNLCNWSGFREPLPSGRAIAAVTQRKVVLRRTAQRQFAALVTRWVAVYRVPEQEARSQLLDFLREDERIEDGPARP